MKETVAYCDLDDKDARRPGVGVLRVEIDGVAHVVDVCQVHLTLLSRLPTTAAVRGRRRGAKRAAKRVPAKRVAKAAAKAPAAPAKRGRPAKKVAAPARKRVAAKATKVPAKRGRPAKKVAVAGRTPGSRRDQQQRIADARVWARSQGRAIAGKGRLPAGLLEEFEAATS